MRPLSVALGTLSLVALCPSTASAWSNHFLVTWPALQQDLSAAPGVRAESFEEFLALNDAGLATVLADEQRWAESHVPTWPALPPELAFAPGGPADTLRRRLLASLRLSPESHQPLYLQLLPGTSPTAGRAPIAASELMLAGAYTEPVQRFERIASGDTVSPLAVVATASDEPDYGLDVQLFADNDGDFGKHSGLGEQPFGNARLSYGSQAPFHIGYYHESSILYLTAGFLKRCYPEQRIHAFLSLARYAFTTGHDYWGWRFLGWALHYVEDLGQPYHARVLPGVGTASLVWASLLAMVGSKSKKEDMLVLTTNQHLVLESFEQHAAHRALVHGEVDNVLLGALGDHSVDATHAPWSDAAPREVITARTSELAGAVRDRLMEVFPARYVADPSYSYSVSEPAVDMYAVLDGAPEKRARFATEVAVLLREVGGHVRAAVKSVRKANGAMFR